MTDARRPRIAVFSGASSTIANTEPLVTSNKARASYGLPPRTLADGSTPRFDVLRPQRLAAPVTVYVRQFSAHPLEEDAAALYAPPDGYLDAGGVFHRERQADGDVPVYEIEADGGPNYSHHASLLNLNLGQPGVPQAPIPVDTDGDLLPDVYVSVNLINIDGRGVRARAIARGLVGCGDVARGLVVAGPGAVGAGRLVG